MLHKLMVMVVLEMLVGQLFIKIVVVAGDTVNGDCNGGDAGRLMIMVLVVMMLHMLMVMVVVLVMLVGLLLMKIVVVVGDDAC